MRWLVTVVLASLLAASPVPAETPLKLDDVPAGASLVLDDRVQPVAAMIGGPSGWSEVRLEAGRVVLRPQAGYTPPRLPELPADALPMSRLAVGTRDIARAWLADATGRYPHGVLGDRLEAATLRVTDADGRRHAVRLPEEAVFEDLRPRIAAIAGRDTLFVVRSTRSAGAALAAYRLDAAGLQEIATTPAIGSPNRWLNPIGIADFDGDGQPEVALVWHPHIGGVLKIYSFVSGRFAELASRAGFSNHDLGSTELGLHAIGDFDGDGVSDLAVRGADRTTLVLMSFVGRDLRVMATVANRAIVAGPVLAADLDGNGRADLLYALADGSINVLRR
jgi:hypothetical protein